MFVFELREKPSVKPCSQEWCYIPKALNVSCNAVPELGEGFNGESVDTVVINEVHILSDDTQSIGIAGSIQNSVSEFVVCRNAALLSHGGLNYAE